MSSSSTHKVSFAGVTIQTTVTDKASIAEAWVQYILSLYKCSQPVIVGLDIEWKPQSIRDRSKKSATLQLCITDKCLILQLFYMDAFPQLLKDFLADSKFTFVGIEVGDDIKKLRNEYGLNCSSYTNIRDAANAKFPRCVRRLGLKDIAFGLMGLKMLKPKHVFRSNWEVRDLSYEQIEYACIDAYCSYRIGYKLIVEM